MSYEQAQRQHDASCPPREREPVMETCPRCDGSKISPWCEAHSQDAVYVEGDADKHLDDYCVLGDSESHDTWHFARMRTCTLCKGKGEVELDADGGLA